jgi:hypothetical protein
MSQREKCTLKEKLHPAKLKNEKSVVYSRVGVFEKKVQVSGT